MTLPETPVLGTECPAPTSAFVIPRPCSRGSVTSPDPRDQPGSEMFQHEKLSVRRGLVGAWKGRRPGGGRAGNRLTSTGRFHGEWQAPGSGELSSALVSGCSTAPEKREKLQMPEHARGLLSPRSRAQGHRPRGHAIKGPSPQ